MSDIEKVVTVNRKARYDYEIVDKYEAGISLLGSEVKALREGRANLKDSYASINGNRVVLHNCHIGPYQPAGPHAQHEAERPRPLLLKQREIDKLRGRIVERGTWGELIERGGAFHELYRAQSEKDTPVGA